MTENLVLAAILVALTSSVHFAGLVGLSRMLRHGYETHPDRWASVLWQGATIVSVVVGLFLLHTLEIGLYAACYLAVSVFDGFETALYFSASTFTTVGFGDIVLKEKWRLLAAAESANGFLLIGWSTAFLVSVTSRVRRLEAGVPDFGDAHHDVTAGPR